MQLHQRQITIFIAYLLGQLKSQLWTVDATAIFHTTGYFLLSVVNVCMSVCLCACLCVCVRACACVIKNISIIQANCQQRRLFQLIATTRHDAQCRCLPLLHLQLITRTHNDVFASLKIRYVHRVPILHFLSHWAITSVFCPDSHHEITPFCFCK